MLTNLLPGLREIRAPLISGYLWLAFFFLAFHEELPSSSDPGPVFEPLFDLGGNISALGLATATGVAAYLVGSAVQELLKLLGRLPSFHRPLYGEAGIRTSSAGRDDVHDAVRIRVQGIRRRLFQVALSPGEKGVDEAPAPEDVEQELPLIRTLLLGERPELIGELDRLKAEADLRITVAFPLAFLAGFLGFEASWGWFALLLPAGLLVLQGYQRQLEAGDLLAKAMRIGKADAPALEALSRSADAALSRIELEGELRQQMDGGDGLAAFRLGNLQASWDDYETAVASLEFAAGEGVVRAYAELGIVHERRVDLGKAERAYRDGDDRGDAKAGTLLASLLRRLEREEEARAAVERKEAEQQTPASDLPDAESEGLVATYRRRVEERDPKAAINLGLLLDRKKDLDGAIAAFRRATEIDDGDAQAWTELGIGLEKARRYQEALPIYERALRIQEGELGPNHLDVGVQLSRLGGILVQLGDHPRARKLLRRALEIKERELGSSDRSVAATLALLALAADDPKEARTLNERSLSIREKVLGPDHVEVAWTLSNLGGTLGELGEYEESHKRLVRALEIKEKEFDPDDLEVAITLGNLGNSFDRLGKYDEALRAQRKGLEIEIGALGEQHIVVARTLLSLSSTHSGRGEYGAARRLAERALAVMEHDLGATNLQTVGARSTLGAVLVHLDEHEEARRHLSEVVESLETTLGPEHPGMGTPLNLLGSALLGLGDHQHAGELHERALAINQRAFGEESLSVAFTLSDLGDALAEGHRADRAVELQTRAVSIARQRLGPSHPQIGHMLSSLGRAQRLVGDLSQSEATHREALEILAASPVAPGSLAPVREGLAETLRAVGRDEEADAELARAAAAEAGEDDQAPESDE